MLRVTNSGRSGSALSPAKVSARSLAGLNSAIVKDGVSVSEEKSVAVLAFLTLTFGETGSLFGPITSESL